MKLPYRNKAIIPLEKLTDYLLSKSHLIGKPKAKLFRLIGFDETNIVIFEQALLKIALNEEVKRTVVSAFGKKYILNGTIRGPRGKTVQIRTIWIIENNKKHPRFVTAYPV